MPQFAVWLPAFVPHADGARRRPDGALEEVVLAEITAAVGHVANARAERRRGRRLVDIITPGHSRREECTKVLGQGGRSAKVGSAVKGFTDGGRGDA
jgi:hypothetical protein